MKLINEDCLIALKNMEDNSIDSIITDPPYNLIKSNSGFERGKDSPYTRTAKGGFMGKEWDGTGIALKVALWEDVWRIAKPGAFLLCFGGTRTYHRIACAIEDAGWQIRDCIMWVYGSGFPKSLDIGKAMDKKNMNYGWHGYGTGLKPAYEPIIVAMKPADGTFANNAIKHGVAGLNIDKCRIPKKEGDRIEYGVNGIERQKDNNVYGKQSGKIQFDGTQGRFPANFIHDGSQEVLDLFPQTKGGTAVRHNSGGNTFGGDNAKPPMEDLGYGDSGSASRFFYCAKASKAERNRGCIVTEYEIRRMMVNEDMSHESAKRLLEGIMVKKKMTNYGSIKKSEGRTGINTPQQNYHPTVKPLKLMEYLCQLTRTPSGGIVLDPFMGSGTTGMACVNTDRDFIGIEKEKEYFKIAQRRIDDTKDHRSQ